MKVNIAVGSINPVKTTSVREAFKNYYEEVNIKELKISSGVSDQPIDDETYRGAENRAHQLVKINRSNDIIFDYFVGIEGGISKTYNKWFAFGCVCIIDKDNRKSFGTSAHFELPDIVTQRLLEREELGIVMDEIMKSENSKQKGGAISFFTNGAMNRKELYVPGIISALVPFNHKKMYFSD